MPATASAATTAYRRARDRLLELRLDYDRAAREWAYPDVGPRFNWAHDWFDAVARGNPGPALVIVEEGSARRSVTFDEMARRSDQVARFLADAGVGRGDPVLLMLGNQVELWEVLLGAMKLGAVLMPATTALGPADLADRVARAGARAVVCNPEDTPKYASVPGDYLRISVGPAAGWIDLGNAADAPAEPVPHPATAPADPLLRYFTSGTTSLPKLVEHSQVSYPVGHLSTMYWLGVVPGDVHCNVSSPGWAKHAWSCVFAPWAAEATVLVANDRRFDPDRLLRQLREEQATVLCAPPTVWRMLVTTDLSGGPGSLRELVAAGEPLNPEVIAQVRRAWGLTVRDGFGQTETTACVANPPGAPVKPGSMGRPLPGVPAAVVDLATGRPLAGTGEGELCLDLSQQPVGLMTGYLGDASRDAEAEAEAEAGGWYHTGDVATVDADGYITFVGRTDDVFKSSDYKVSPFEVESALVQHPAVVEAAVVPAPDPLRLCVPKAYVALAAGYEPTAQTARGILAYARERLAPYQRVRRLEFAELPKTISGKIRRVDLRGREERLATAGTRPEGEWRVEDFDDLAAAPAGGPPAAGAGSSGGAPTKDPAGPGETG